MEKKWYVFDQHDCFNHCLTAADAALEAEHMSQGGFTGIHIVQMTEAQFNEYCTNNNLAAALKIRNKA